MSAIVTTTKQDDIGIITIDYPPVNVLSQPVRAGLMSALAQLGRDETVTAIVLICAGHTFVVGIDITEFGKPLLEPYLNTVIDALENTRKPIVAALHGHALGAGLDLALASHYRCAVTSAEVGYPEVNLGLLPGLGGTQRLPRLAGIETALEMIVSGKAMPATQAHQAGIIDEIIAGDLLSGAVDYARRLVAENAPRRRIRDLYVDGADLSSDFFSRYRRTVAAKTRGYFAPERCVQAVEASVFLPFAKGLRQERALFIECMASTESKALRHLFLAEHRIARIPGIDEKTPRRRLINRVAVVGAGTMGSGIAMSCANAGLPVTLLDVDGDTLQRGLATIRRNYERSVQKGKLNREQCERRCALIQGTLNDADLAAADLIIEAVFENLNLKQKVFARLDAIAKPGAILATNTSTLNVDAIAAATRRPADIIGLHFFSPAHVMRLLEIVRAEHTAADVIATCMDLSQRIGKIGVLVGVCYGFVGNRMLRGYLREANELLLEGALPEQIDHALREFGMAMGPFAMCDLAGIDVGYRVRQENKEQQDTGERYFLISDRLAERGCYGQKTGRGFYRYETGSRTPLPDPEVHALIAAESARLGISRRDIAEREIVERCLYPLINEGALILEEGIALRPGDIDTIWINGYGFPRYHGGPMFYADVVGLEVVFDALSRFQDRYGEHWKPAPLLEKLALQDLTFGTLDEE